MGIEVEKKFMLVRMTASCFVVTMQISPNVQSVEPLDTEERTTGVMRKGCTELLIRYNIIFSINSSPEVLVCIKQGCRALVLAHGRLEDRQLYTPPDGFNVVAGVFSLR